jgi:hypothetical protein
LPLYGTRLEAATGIMTVYFSGTPLYVKQDSGPRPGKQGRLSDALWARKEYPVSERGGTGAANHD